MIGKIKCDVGIDPDVKKSGLALYFKDDNRLLLEELELYPLFMRLIQLSLKYDVTVYLEAGHKVKQTWQKRTVGTVKAVGRNNEIGSQIEKFLISQGIKHVLVKPCGYSDCDHELFCKITNWNIKKLTNPEKRSAGLMAVVKGVPLKYFSAKL